MTTVMAGRDAIADKPPIHEKRDGARPKVSSSVTGRNITADKPSNLENELSDKELLQATL